MDRRIRPERRSAKPIPQQRRNIFFFFLADGAGITHMEITRQYNRVVHNEGLIIADKIMKEGNARPHNDRRGGFSFHGFGRRGDGIGEWL